jgi:enoyl-CoA hydratase
LAHENLLVEAHEGVCVVSVNRADKRNALDAATVGELDAVFASLGADPAVRGVVLTGAGESIFAAGADIAELERLTAADVPGFCERRRRLVDRIEWLGKPVIAAVNGYALGAGCELALACHVRIASDNAVFGLPAVKLGLICGYGGTQRLPRLVGRGRALELLLTGERIDATEALRIGLVNKVVFRDRLLEEAEALLRRMVVNPSRALRSTLEAVNGGVDRPLGEAQEGEAALFAEVLASEDAKEGLRAFLEKRPARFTGR